MADRKYGKLYATGGPLSKGLGRQARAHTPPKKATAQSNLKFKAPADAKVSNRINTIRRLIPKIKRTYGRYVQRYAQQYGARYGVDPERLEPLVYSMIAAESGGNPRAVSPVGAAGLMQLMPRTWKGAGVSDPHDPKQNVKAGTKIVAEYLARYGGNARRALTAYNAGSSNLRLVESGQREMPEETQEYVPAILESLMAGQPEPES